MRSSSRSRPRPGRQPALETLEGRALLSARAVGDTVVPAAAQVLTAAKDDAKKESIKRSRVTIYGVLIPAIYTSKTGEGGANLVSAGIVWKLDLTATRGLTAYAQRLVSKPLAVYGTAKIEKDSSGKLKREIKVTWMEPLKGVNLPRPYPAGTTPGKPK